MTIEDPYSEASRIDSAGNLDVAARLENVQHADGTLAEGMPAWVPPSRPTMTVIRTLRDDPIGRMHSRHQIDESQYQAARAFQEAADRSMLGSVKSIDWGKTRVSGGAIPDPLPEGRQRAMKYLRRGEDAVRNRHGAEGLAVTRTVLIDRQSLEATARSRGAESDREIWFWGNLFKRCLNVLAVSFNFANSVRRPPRLKAYDGEDPALDPSRHATDDEIFDLKLRYSVAKRRPA
jgi:hypothetical protein